MKAAVAAALILALNCPPGVAADAVQPTDGDRLPAAFPAADWIDPVADPATDFFAYANGGWLKRHAIPDAYADWGLDRELALANDEFIHQLLEDSRRDQSAPPGSDWRKIGDFYASGMDEAAIESAGIKPLLPELQRIDALKEHADLPALLAHLHLIGVDAVFGVSQGQDYRDSSQVIAFAAQGGLGLPDRDYYLEDDAKFRQVRSEYRSHVARMFVLVGESRAQAEADAARVFELEMRLAKASMPDADQRDPHAVYHPMGMARLKSATQGFDWNAYYAALGIGPMRSTNLMMPDFFRAAGKELRRRPLADWKAYLRWHTVHAFAGTLSKPFVDENFRLERVLTGTAELKPRWQRVAHMEEAALGFSIGRIYVERKFSPAARQAADELVTHVRAALHDALTEAQWLTPATRQRALEKLAQMRQRVGYPDKWRDYSGLSIDRGPLVQNVMRANRFELERQLAKIGKPVDRDDWDMTPQTVNAYYDPSQNSINVPAAQLQPPYFSADAPAAANYGAIGSVIGHEMTHGFDDEGSQFDGHGNLVDWWEKPDRAAFRKRIACIADQYSKLTVDGGLHLQGKLVAGEAAADLGGVLLSYRAFHAALKDGATASPDATSPDRPFFISYAQSWATALRPELLRQMAVSDPHPPPQYRVDATLADVAAFRAAFDVGAGKAMASAEPCVIW